jgi:response regulator of citrate/malate metabolism
MGNVQHSDDVLELLDDISDQAFLHVSPWRVLVVDDDGEVHQATRFALSDVEIMDRPLLLIHAYSAAEAEVLLRQMPDIAVVLLDVVMEEDDSGLSLIDLVREGLAYKPLRIILRTGQPGLAPEASLVARYDIHDYMLKTEVSRERLLTSLTTAIRTFDQLKQIVQMKQQMLGMRQVMSNMSVKTTHTELAHVIANQLTTLYSLSPIVVVWHRVNDDFSNASIVATDLAHISWQDKKLSELSAEPLLSYITQLLSSGVEDQFSDSILLNGDGWRFVVVLQENDFEQQLVSESWQLFRDLMIACTNHALTA